MRRRNPVLLPLALAASLGACADDQLLEPQTHSFDVVSGKCVVTDAGDSGPGTLRALIADPSCLVITFAGNLKGSTIPLASGLVIDRNVVIDGHGRNLLTVQRQSADLFRVFTINADKTVTLSGMTITGGALDFAAAFEVGTGGGIFSQGNLTLRDVRVSGNTARWGGGLMQGLGQLVVENSEFVDNTADFGGGVYLHRTQANITHSRLNDNFAIEGAGINVNTLVVATIENTTIADNRGTSAGGGIINFGNGSLVVRGSTVSGNQLSRAAFTAGGGIYNVGNLSVENSTISGNRATSTASLVVGGGIYSPGGSLTLLHTTLTANQAQGVNPGVTFGGGIYSATTLTLENSILSGNVSIGFGPDLVVIAGTLSAIHTLISNAAGHSVVNGSNGNIVGTPAQLGPLADNGGPTWTHELLTGSPGVDVASSVLNIGLDHDQRGPGYPRLFGNGVDMGAFEIWTRNKK